MVSGGDDVSAGQVLTHWICLCILMLNVKNMLQKVQPFFGSMLIHGIIWKEIDMMTNTHGCIISVEYGSFINFLVESNQNFLWGEKAVSTNSHDESLNYRSVAVCSCSATPEGCAVCTHFF